MPKATLIDYVKANKPQGFTPRPFYSVEGDSLTFYFDEEESYRERVDDFLTLYKSIKTDKLVGCQLKGLAQVLKLLGDFGLTLEDRSVRLSMIFMARAATAPMPGSRDRYLELGRMAKEALIPKRELEAALD